MQAKRLSSLLSFARRSIDAPLDLVFTAGDVLCLKLRDGRTGILYLEDGEPRLDLPEAV